MSLRVVCGSAKAAVRGLTGQAQTDESLPSWGGRCPRCRRARVTRGLSSRSSGRRRILPVARRVFGIRL